MIRKILILLVFFPFLVFAQEEGEAVSADNNSQTIKLNNEFSLAIPVSKSNILYIGMDNELILYEDDKKTSDYKILTDNGNAYNDSLHYLVFPDKPGKANYFFYTLSPQNQYDTNYIAEAKLKAIKLPNPEITINGKNVGKMDKLQKSFLLEADSIGIYITDDIIGINDWFDIMSFTFGYIYGRHYISYKNEGKYFSEKSKHAIRNLLPGREISIRITIKNNSNITIIPPIFRAKIY